METRRIVVEVVGWAGALLLLAAYAFLSSGHLAKPNVLYHLANLVGATGLMVNAASHRSWPPVVVNLVWSGIAVSALALSR